METTSKSYLSLSIYGFRDTTPEYIIHFSDYIGHPVKDMYLLENRRSTPEILDIGNSIIALNKEKVEKSLIPVRSHGEPVFLKGFYEKKAEREFIVDEIEKLIKSGEYKPEDICVIDRKRSGLSAIGTMLTERGIPWIPKVGCKCQYKNDQKVENKNVHFPRSIPQLVFP